MNADVAKEISDYVKKIEDETLGKRRIAEEVSARAKVSNEKLQPRQGEELERDIDAIEEEKRGIFKKTF